MSTELARVLQTHRLREQPGRRPDYVQEGRALAAVVRAVACSPAAVLWSAAEAALALCEAQSAGVAVLAADERMDTFTRPAVVGAWSHFTNTCAPRHFSPYGVVVERDAPQLFHRPQQLYTYVADVRPPIEELLLAPFHCDGRAVGALWVVLHDPGRQFDAEDERRLTSVARCASAVHQVALSVERLANGQPADNVAGELLRLSRLLEAAPPIGPVAPASETLARALSPREFAVVRLVAEGYTNEQIGLQLNVSPKTIATYRARACDKLGFRSRADFVNFAVRHRLLPP